jgi:hypothetical protein
LLASRGLNRQQLAAQMQSNVSTPVRASTAAARAGMMRTPGTVGNAEPSTPIRARGEPASGVASSTKAQAVPISAAVTAQGVASLDRVVPAASIPMLFDKSVHGHLIAQPHIMWLSQCVSEAIYLIVCTFYNELPRFQFNPPHAALLRHFTSFYA